MATVAVTRRARLQIDLIVDYLDDRNPAAAKRFEERLSRAFRQLADFPLSGTRARMTNTRHLVVVPYVLTYRVSASGIEILDIRHGRQREAPPPEDI